MRTTRETSWRARSGALAVTVGALLTVGVPQSQAADGAVGFQVSAAAQRGALGYWTAARMSATAPNGIPTARRFGGARTIGGLFFTTGGKSHFCTASVVNSAAGDLVVTA